MFINNITKINFRSVTFSKLSLETYILYVNIFKNKFVIEGFGCKQEYSELNRLLCGY